MCRLRWDMQRVSRGWAQKGRDVRKYRHVRSCDAQKYGARENGSPGPTLRQGTRQRGRETDTEKDRHTGSQAKAGQSWPSLLGSLPAAGVSNRHAHPPGLLAE